MKRLAVLGATLALVTPAAASASSIVYSKGNDLWLSTPDGARRVAVTHASGTSAFASPSQADDGTIAAVDEQSRLVRLDRRGRVLSAAPLFVRPGNRYGLTGPVAPVLSPDGTKVAFGFGVRQSSCDPVTCSTADDVGMTYTYAKRLTDPSELGSFRGWSRPSWIDNARVLAFAPGTSFTGAPTVVFDTVGADPPTEAGWTTRPSGWFSDADDAYLAFGTLTRAKDKLAVGAGLGLPTVLKLYSVTSAPPDLHEGDAAPVLRCALSAPEIRTASWAPDGSALVYEVGGKIFVVSVGDLAARGCAAVGAPRLLDEGLSPLWGPADVPTVSVALAGRPPALGTALRFGLRVRVIAPAGSAVRVVARRGRLTVASGHTRVGATGTVTVRVRFTPAARRSLRSRRSVALDLTAATATARVILVGR